MNDEQDERDDYPTFEDVFFEEIGVSSPATESQIGVLVEHCGVSYSDAINMNKAAARSLISDFVREWQEEREACGMPRVPEKHLAKELKFPTNAITD